MTRAPAALTAPGLVSFWPGSLQRRSWVQSLLSGAVQVDRRRTRRVAPSKAVDRCWAVTHAEVPAAFAAGWRRHPAALEHRAGGRSSARSAKRPVTPDQRRGHGRVNQRRLERPSSRSRCSISTCVNRRRTRAATRPAGRSFTARLALAAPATGPAPVQAGPRSTPQRRSKTDPQARAARSDRPLGSANADGNRGRARPDPRRDVVAGGDGVVIAAVAAQSRDRQDRRRPQARDVERARPPAQ